MREKEARGEGGKRLRAVGGSGLRGEAGEGLGNWTGGSGAGREKGTENGTGRTGRAISREVFFRPSVPFPDPPFARSAPLSRPHALVFPPQSLVDLACLQVLRNVRTLKVREAVSLDRLVLEVAGDERVLLAAAKVGRDV